MKLYFLILGMAAVVATVYADEGKEVTPDVTTRTPVKRCQKQEDCGEDECCLWKGFTRRGSCKPRGRIDERCNIESQVEGFFGKYIHICPCIGGLTCIAHGELHVPFIGKVDIDYKCTNADTTTAVKDVGT